MNPSQAMSMEESKAVVYSSANPYRGGLPGLQPFIDQIIQIIETKAPYENVRDLMLDVFAGEDIMDNMPPVVQTAAVVGGDNPSTASGCALNGRTFYVL
jgi:hypothetical protein